MTQNKYTRCILAFALGLAYLHAPAQGPVQGPVQGTPRVEQPNQGGGGVGIGINIDLGSVINAIRNATRKEEPSKPPILQKKAVAVSSGASGNYTIDWVVQYANNTGTTLPKVTVKDGPIATIINPSLVPHLVPQQGWTGTTNGNIPVDNYALFSGTNIAPHGVMTSTFLTPGPTSFNTNSGTADGYQPIMYQHSSGPRAYWIAHHHSAMGCFDLKTGSNCAGTWPKNTPIGDGSANWSRSTLNNSEYFIQSGKLYYSVNHIPSQKSGVGCYDLEADTQCGFTQLTPKPSEGLTTPAAIFGPWLVGNEAYMASANGDLFCMKYPALTPCTGTSYRIADTVIKLNVSSVNFSNSDTVAVAGHIAGKVVGTKLYLTSLKGATKSTASKFVNCFDAVTKQACWSGALPTKGTAAHSYSNAPNKYWGNISNFLYFNTSGLAQAICTRSASKQDCVELSSGNLINLPKVLGSTNLDVGLEAHLWPKTYFVAATHFGNGAIDAKALCWDWISGGYCNGGNDYVISQAPTTNTEDYGAAVDENGCVWVLGHLQKLWNFDPNNLDANKKAQRCGGATGKAQLTFQPLQYCSGPKPFHWTSVEVKGAPLANYDKFIVKVLDSSNSTVLFTKDLKASGQLLASITGVDAQTLSKPLKIEVEFTPKPGMGASDKPYLEVRYNAPPIEFCFKSTHTCQQAKITNIVETPDPVKQGSYISVKVDVDKPQNCTFDPPPPPPPPPPPNCGTATTPACCGQPGQPVCPDALCGQPGQRKCPDPICIPGTPGCPIIGIGCAPGDPLCNPRPPKPPTTCLTGDCPDKPQQSIAEEYKAPKVACVRKAKTVDQPAAAAKPRPKPAVAAAPPAPVDPNAPPKPKPKPRPKPAQTKPAAQDEDC